MRRTKRVLAALRTIGATSVRWAEVRAIVFGAAVTLCCTGWLVLLARDISREIEAARVQETSVYGFDGYFQGSIPSSRSDKRLRYQLYVPPHFQTEKGPFPLIVFMPGYGERHGSMDIGLAPAIRRQVKRDGRFDFVVFFAMDPEGCWQRGSEAAWQLKEMLDSVILRHRIDPCRVYLTGHSGGGCAVWNLAAEFPDMWAALAPVVAGCNPEVEAIKGIPCWVFQGAKDSAEYVKGARKAVRDLRDAGTQVEYTEYPKDAHIIWQRVYYSDKLFKWFAEQKKPAQQR